MGRKLNIQPELLATLVNSKKNAPKTVLETQVLKIHQ